VPAAEIESFVRQAAIPDAAYAIGEPALGLNGWRLSHGLAQDARRVAIIAPEIVTTYAGVGVLAPWALDRSRALAFIDVHLGPLTADRDGGASARETLREIFKAGHQIAAAASALNVHRGTLSTRLTRIERALGFSVHTRQAELEIALRLGDLYGLHRKS
jgi:DNA-binding PucR family transcriptional regulator